MKISERNSFIEEGEIFKGLEEGINSIEINTIQLKKLIKEHENPIDFKTFFIIFRLIRYFMMLKLTVLIF